MPISTDEFEAGTVDESRDDGGGDSPIEDETELVLSFLSERPDRAFTAREIVLGVDFSPLYEVESETRGVPSLYGPNDLVDGLVDVAGDVTASAVVVDDVDEALTALLEDGAVERTAVETGEGSTTYYRLAE